MADIAPTQAAYGNGDIVVNIAPSGEAIAYKDAVYKNVVDKKWWKIDVDDAARMAQIPDYTRHILGIALHAVTGADIDLAVAVEGTIDLGSSVMTAGVAYMGSDTAGKLRPAADNASGDHLVYYGTASTAAQLELNPMYYGKSL